MQYKGIFIMIDGIAGSGKSTLLQALKTDFSGKRVFDMQTWNAEHTQPPTFADISEYDIYFTFEPTKTWIGSAIRHEISFHADMYSPRVQAEAFALDRLIQYHRFIIPALQAGKIIIQDRGVTTSLVYQGSMDSTLTQKEIVQLEGNRVALAYAPQHLILTQIDPHIAQARRANRQDISKGIYEDTDLLRRAQEIFHSSSFRGFMEEYGTTIHTIDTSSDIDISTQTFLSLIHSFITL